MEHKSEQYENYREIRKQWMDVSKIVRNRDSFLKNRENKNGPNLRKCNYF